MAQQLLEGRLKIALIGAGIRLLKLEYLPLGNQWRVQFNMVHTVGESLEAIEISAFDNGLCVTILAYYTLLDGSHAVIMAVKP